MNSSTLGLPPELPPGLLGSLDDDARARLAGAELVAGPRRDGSEMAWWLRRPDGTHLRVGQLLEELRHELSVSERYRRDVERSAAIRLDGVCTPVAWGDGNADGAPWRVTPWPVEVGERGPDAASLRAWIDGRAPADLDESRVLLSRIADLLESIHGAGHIVRSLEPRRILLDGSGRPWLSDLGLARVDVLSTRTAASLILEASPYLAPELIGGTVADARADLFAFGVLAYELLTGLLPFGEGPALMRELELQASVASLRASLDGVTAGGRSVEAELEAALAACLRRDPNERPERAADVAAALRGESTPVRTLAIIACQSCGSRLRPGQRLCVACGKEAVQFANADAQLSLEERYIVELRKVAEDAESMARLRSFLQTIGRGDAPDLNFIVGDARMYSKSERDRLHALPCAVVRDVDRHTAERVADELRACGHTPNIVSLAAARKEGLSAKARRSFLIGGSLGAASVGVTAALLASSGALVAGAIAATVTAVTLGLTAGIIHLALRPRRKLRAKAPLAELRATPAALPASDPLVARLAALLDPGTPADVRDQVGELALRVQALVDHRAANESVRGEIELALEPVMLLVTRVEREVEALRRMDADLTELDEGRLVRALAASEARGEAPAMRVEILEGLERLRVLEDARAAAMRRLLEASALCRRAVELGVAVHDSELEHERQVQRALAALGE